MPILLEKLSIRQDKQTASCLLLWLILNQTYARSQTDVLKNGYVRHPSGPGGGCPTQYALSGGDFPRLTSSEPPAFLHSLLRNHCALATLPLALPPPVNPKLTWSMLASFP